MKNKFWCVLKVFLNNLINETKINIENNAKLIKNIFIIFFCFIISLLFAFLFPYIFGYVLGLLIVILFPLYVLLLTILLLNFIINKIKEKYQIAKEECWDILGDDK